MDLLGVHDTDGPFQGPGGMPKKRPDQKGGILMAQMMQNIECEFAELTLY